MTPGGKLQKGDRLEHATMPYVLFEVIERDGESVVIKRVDGGLMPLQLGPRTETYRMLEASWKIRHSSITGWVYVP